MSREARTIRLTADELLTIGSIFRHFKGRPYKVSGFAWAIEDGGQLVLYRDLAEPWRGLGLDHCVSFRKRLRTTPGYGCGAFRKFLLNSPSPRPLPGRRFVEV